MGCAWDPAPNEDLPQHRSMIVGKSRGDLKHSGVTWAHEFGHRTGLPHRNDRNALMACEVKVGNVEINQHECDCLRGGPGFCDDPPGPARTMPHRSLSHLRHFFPAGHPIARRQLAKHRGLASSLPLRASHCSSLAVTF